MNDEINYKTNPLHGLSLKKLLIELVDHYGFEILFAYLNIHCFKTNPSVESSVKFLKKTEWAREKVEAFYLYKFKNLPQASHGQFQLPPRDRVIPEGQMPGEPVELTLEDAEVLREERARKAAEYESERGGRQDSQRNARRSKSRSDGQYRGDNRRSSSPSSSGDTVSDTWAKARARIKKRK